MEQVEAIIEQVTTTLSELAQSDVVVGSPIELGQVTVVPISRISAGFGGAGGEGEADTEGKKSKNDSSSSAGTGKGSGSGGAALVRPVAVVVLSEARVDVLTIPEKPGKLGKLADQIPELIERLQKRGKS